ncbi:lanthionine synthetase LanC family protein [Labedaea rhizosphaerae]|uniref:non-specific serine/threonine protein kinase n=1 Tax=Labedaea rhizosphaerae TaxID=598644 RepID=A0A4R6S7U2_LABRH|nr:lanthionine synthetase LanC family protein [Labedaea rhizosphaerae]TDP94885.1 protein kinase-like protein [Labedaea rhizosphaerae]
MQARVRELVDGHDYDLCDDHVWLTVTPAGFDYPEHGWKLHISTRAATFDALVEKLVPALVAERCAFKLARSVAVLEELNDGHSHPASVGKAFTVYPRPSQVRALGLSLAQLLRGHEGPPVVSDRRVDPDAPVYYRYGPMRGGPLSLDAHGRFGMWVAGPDGDRFDALAGLRYRRPSWAQDPFADDTPTGPMVLGPMVLAGQYRVDSGIREAAPGNVYRATDLRDGTAVVVKQARPFVGERVQAPGRDRRLLMRNERRVLRVLDGVEGVPRFVDHFAQGGDEFLATEDRGGRSLDEAVRADGPLALPEVLELGHRLATVLRAVHDRGVVMRDLTPANVVLDGMAVSLVDFGIAAYDGFHLAGHTPGYAPARQVRDEPPRELDDLHSLAMTLAFAATGYDPVDDAEVARVRVLQTLPRLGAPVEWGVLADLLSEDEDCVRAAFDRLADGAVPRPPLTAMPAPPDVTPDRLTEIIGNVRADLLSMVDDVLRPDYHASSEHDLNLHGGVAGVGLELLRHLDIDGVRERVTELIGFIDRVARRIPVSSGLFTGRTGIAVFFAEAAAQGFAVPAFRALTDGWRERGPDVTDGVAGIGLGHLRLHRVTGDPAHAVVAAECARLVATTADPESMVPPAKRLPGVDGSAGSAHGLAGMVDLLLAHADHTGDAADHAVAACRTHVLVARTRSLINAAPAADPLAGSWCQGLAGIARTLYRAADVLGDDSLVPPAVEALEAAAELAPRMATLSLCCGVAGVGNALIGAGRTEAAHDLLTTMVLRGGGTEAHPVFVAPSPNTRSVSWAGGLAGILGFLRRLADEKSPDPVP